MRTVRGKVRRDKSMTASELRAGAADRKSVSRFLVYALPRPNGDDKATVRKFDDFHLHDLPLGHPDSFANFEAVVCFAGAFEDITPSEDVWERSTVKCARNDLDRREREFFTAIERGTPFVFLARDISLFIDNRPNAQTDLFRRVLDRFSILWQQFGTPLAHAEATIPEFRKYFEKHGVAYLQFNLENLDDKSYTAISGTGNRTVAFEVGRKLFFLPCRNPQTQCEAQEIAADALRAVSAYRERMTQEMPEWVGEFQFTKEKAVRVEVDRHRAETVRLETELDGYTKRKGALCYRSEPLVEVVIALLESVFGLRIESDEQCIEDACVLDGDGNILAVVEIKGVKGNFKRDNVNQVDSHRERRRLPPETPGLLIMNTKIDAESLAEKDDAPHPETIAKAVQDKVLLVRTLDLLRYADLVESGTVAKEDFSSTILSDSGWLKVENNAATVVKE